MPFLTMDLPEVYSLKPRVISRGFTVNIEIGKRVVAGRVWHSQVSSGTRPLLLIGHQEAEDKNSPEVQELVKILCGKYGFVIATMDGPLHGARRFGTTDSELMKMEFDQLWLDGDESISSMTLDWKLTVDALCELQEVDSRCIGYFGLSMGTAYGIEVLASDLRISAAVLGQWGGHRAHQERLLQSLQRINCPIEFYAYEKDPNIQQQKTFFEAFRAKEKQWQLYSKPLIVNDLPSVEKIAQFFVVQLLDRYLY